MTPDAPLIEVAREVAADLRRWYRAFSGLTGYAVDMGHAAERLEDAAKRAGGTPAGVDRLSTRWAAREILWPPGEDQALLRGTHSIRDDDELVIALTWGAERAERIARLPDTERILSEARDRILRLEMAVLNYLDHPEADGALGRLGSALRQDFDEAVRLG